MPGRAMAGYVALPPAVIADDRAIRTWVDRAIAFGETLPPKRPKPSKTAKAASGKRATS